MKMLVKIYIEILIAGRFDRCKGKYSCVLEIEHNGIPVSKVHYGAWKEISLQRLQLRACITAMEHMVRESEVEIHINAPSIKSMFTSEKTSFPAKNKDLWKRFMELCEKHLVTIVQEKQNICSEAMRQQLKNMDIEYQEEKNGE